MLLVNKYQLAENNSFTEYSQNKKLCSFQFFQMHISKDFFFFPGLRNSIKIKVA